MNKIVISVNEQCDGTAESIINDVSRELKKLRETAGALGLPNSNCINWTLISSSTSDSAATQKKFNCLIEQQKEADTATYGTNAPESAIEIIENFCAMHLGCNLRKAFLAGVKSISDHKTNKDHSREYHQVDVFVHEFHKLFGKYGGTPEYGCGTVMYPDFLKIKATDDTLCVEESTYHQACLDISLDRQIGSRYFVTAANAMKIMFLKDSAISFLKFTFRHTKGNKLEKDLFMKLNDVTELVQLKMDALMFYHVYADLVELAKSRDLKKSVLDMSIHYLELQSFLKLLQECPETIMDSDYRVFTSEALLYGDKKFNHRARSKSILIQRYVFKEEEWDKTLLYPLLIAGAKSMENKLNTYAQSQLPGGIYWNPEPKIQEILSKLEPSNDICEAVLGLNDYLSTAIPNLCQESRSNLVEVKKNKTMKWLDTLPEEKQDKVLGLAMERRLVVANERKEDNEKYSEKRRKKMLEDHSKKMALLQKVQEEREKLSHLHVITSSDELSQCIEEIENESCSSSKKKTKQYALLREQINIRNKLLDQDIHIVFSQARRKRPVEEIKKELAEFIESTTASVVHEVTNNGHALVGKCISHKFEVDTAEEKWYDGIIVNYDCETKIFEIKYDEEEEHCSFDLTEDAMMGDLLIH